MSLPPVARSQSLFAQALDTIPGGTQLFSRRPDRYVPGATPMYIERGKGGRIWDVDGNEYIDFMMGVGPVILGHCYDAVDEAVIAQVHKGNVYSTNSPLEVELAAELIETIPCAEMVRFGKCGGEIDAVAVRIARGYTGRDKVAFCGYHGWHDWYLAANLGDDSTLDGHLMPGLDVRGVPKALRGTIFPFEYNNADSLRALFDAHPGEIGCVIMEPMRSGAPEPGFLESVRDLAHERGAVLVFDEVITGFRVALGGAQEFTGVTPDLATFAKAMSNGYPLAAVCGRREVMETVSSMFISSTYWSEATGLAAGLATIRELRAKDALKRIWATGERLQAGMNDLAVKHGLDLAVKGLPPVQKLDVHCEDAHLKRQIITVYIQELLRRSILTGAVTYICYQHTDADIETMLAACDEAFGVIAKGLAENNLPSLIEAGEYGGDFRRFV